MSDVEEAIQKRLDDFRVLANQLFDLTRGEAFHKDDIPWHGQLKVDKKDATRLLKTLAGNVHGFLKQQGGEKPWAWTLEAKKIKERGKSFIDEWPKKQTVVEEAAPAAPAGPASDQPDAAADSPSPEVKPQVDGPVDLVVSDRLGPIVGPLNQPPALDDLGKPLLTAPETDLTAKAEAVPEAIVFSAPTPLRPLFLTPDEIPVFEMLEAAPNLLGIAWFNEMGLAGVRLDLFLAKMRDVGIMANGPEGNGEGEKIVFSSLAYSQYQGNYFKISTSVALDKFRNDLQQLLDEQAVLKGQLKDKEAEANRATEKLKSMIGALDVAKLDAREARCRLEEAETLEKEALDRKNDADQEQQIAEAALTAIEKEIAAADLENRIAAFQEFEMTAVQLDQRHSEACHYRYLNYLISPAGKEV
ncbi:MAG: hypothetical protein WC831_03725 [Parcubacteria group bacterium]|jgi:hypothetical protein